jgi:AcrR family transcriptional regulator
MVSMPRYEATGRTAQKSRTRTALVEAGRRLLAEGRTPTIEDTAASAGVGRTTAYRYFPTQEALILAAHPEVGATTLLGPEAPTHPKARFELALAEHLRIVRDWEPQLRASLRVSLMPGAEQPPLRGGRAIGWFLAALEPLAATHPTLDLRRLAIRLRATAGIESYVWLTDVAGLSPDEAVEVLRTNAMTLLSAVLAQHESASGGSASPAVRRGGVSSGDRTNVRCR